MRRVQKKLPLSRSLVYIILKGITVIVRPNNKMEQKPVCTGGDAVTVWGLKIKDIPVYYFRMEGKELSELDRNNVLTFYSDVIAKNDRFVTLYDLSNGLKNFSTHVIPFAKFCNDIRPITKGHLQFTVTVCPNALYRNLLSALLRLAPANAPFYLVETLDEAWNVLARSGKGEPIWIPDSQSITDSNNVVSL